VSISAGSVVFIALFSTVVCCYIRRRSEKRPAEDPADPERGMRPEAEVAENDQRPEEQAPQRATVAQNNNNYDRDCVEQPQRAEAMRENPDPEYEEEPVENYDG